MAAWRVEYHTRDGHDKVVLLILPDDQYQTARAVQVAAQQGTFREVKVMAGTVVLVRPHHPFTMGA